MSNEVNLAGTVLSLEIRKTFSYVGTYADLDSWESFGAATIIASEAIEADPEDCCDAGGRRYCARIQCDSPSTPEMIETALDHSFSRRGCSHEYDCCGCISTGVGNIVNEAGNVWSFDVTGSKNY